MKTKKCSLGFKSLVLLFAFFASTLNAQISKQNNYSSISEIAGVVYFDANNNGVFDQNDFGIPNQTVVIADGKYIGVTDENGAYQIIVEPGNYEITAQLSGSQKLTTGNQSANIKSGEKDLDNNFGVTCDPATADLQINLIDVNQPQPGLISTIELIYMNKGAAQPEGNIIFVKDRNYIYSSAVPSPTSINGDTLVWAFYDLKPFKQEHIKINMQLPEIITTGTILNSMVTISGNENDPDRLNNQDTLLQSASGAIIPNSKIVDPSGVVKTYSTAPANVSLIYTIHFQNTTNMFVKDMVIIDTLTTKLSPGTFTLLGSSHSCTIQFSANTLTFEFLNINLPDSALDLNGSRGWIQFLINTANNVFLNDSVKNVADIYFDYNVPTRTNEARIDFVNVSAIDEYNRSEFVKVYPNPFDENFEVQFEKPCFDCVFELTDITGKTLQKQVLGSETKYSFDRKKLASGFYVYKITQQNQVVEVGKLIAR
jgi:hypothetical protein